MAAHQDTHTLHLSTHDGASAIDGAGATYTHDGQGVINLSEPGDVSAWTSRLGCSEERLRLAIAAVGPEVQEVCNHLGTLLPARPLSLHAGNGTTH